MIRAWLILVISVIAFFGSIIAAVATATTQSETLRGYVDATYSHDLPFRVPRPGINVDLTQYTADELTYQLNLMQQANFRWIRQTFRWTDIEREQGVYDWTIWDTIVNAIEQKNTLQLVAVIDTAPEWARTDNTATDTAPPRNPQMLADFMTQFATRYGNQIDYYQIWDEPNLALGWGGTSPNAAQYAALLAAAYDAIHAYDPQATVISAGLAPTTAVGPLTIPETDFLRALYAHGAQAFSDAIATKTYGFDSVPTDPVRTNTLNFRRIVLLREIMVEQGDSKKSIWATQWGWNSLPDDWAGSDSVWGQVSNEDRINYTLEALDYAERYWPWLGGMILEAWQPDVSTDNPRQGFALLDTNGETQPLYNALVARTPHAAATNGLHAVTSPDAIYSGIWTFGELGADVGWVNDSQVEFKFSGSDIAVLTRQDDYVANFYVQINNEAANALPQASDNQGFLALTSGSLQPELKLVVVGRGLDESKNQTLQIVASELIPDDPTNRWPLVGFAVSSGNLNAPYERQITTAWLTAFAAGISVIVSALQVNWRKAYPVLRSIQAITRSIIALPLSTLASITLMIGMLLTWSEGIPLLFRREPISLLLSMLTAGLVYLQPGPLLTLFSSALLFLFIYHRAYIGLFLVIIWSPFFLFPVELYTFAFPTAEIILWITIAARLLYALVQWARSTQHERQSQTDYTFKLNRHWLDLAIIAYVILGTISMLMSQRLDPAITEFRTLFIQPVLFYVLLRTANLDKRQVTLLIDGLLLAGFLVAFIGLLQFIRGEAIITAEDGVRRLASIYGSPNNVGLLMGRCIPFALAFVMLQVDRRRRIAAGIALLAMVLAAILTQSVGALAIGIPAGIATTVFFIYRRRAILPLIGLAVIGIITLSISAQISPRFERAFDMSQGTNFYRLRVWESATQAITDHPVTGLGLDQFLYEYRGTYMMPDAWEEPNLSHPHNIMLDLWTRLGIMGPLWFLFVQFAFWRNMNMGIAQSTINRGQNRTVLAIIAGTSGSMANLLTHGLIDNSIFVLDLAYIFMLLLVAGAFFKNIGAIDTIH